MPVIYDTVDIVTVTSCRSILVISGRKVIREALVTKSVDFADRPESYAEMLVNKHAKGS